MDKKRIVNKLRILYLFWMIVGLLSILYIPSKIIIEDDAAATASNILSNELLFRSGIVGSLLTQLLFIWVVLVLFQFFKDVDKKQSTLMLIFALVSVPIAMLNTLNQVAALLAAKGGENVNLVMFFLNLNEQGIIIASIFWGLWLFPLGILVNKSGYFPRFIGYALYVGGVGYFVGSLLQLLIPTQQLILSIFDIMVFGEMIFIFWLLIKGAKLKSTNKNFKFY
jgi:hypothetical protein